MIVKPLGNLVLVEMIEQKSVTPQGIHIPEEAQKALTMNLAKVLDTGPGTMLQNGQWNPVPVKAGDTVLFPGAAHPYPLEWMRIPAVPGKENSGGHRQKRCLILWSEILAIVQLEPQDRLQLVSADE